jgi:hypothetical protein
MIFWMIAALSMVSALAILWVLYLLTASFSGHDPHRMVHTYGLHKGPD